MPSKYLPEPGNRLGWLSFTGVVLRGVLLALSCVGVVSLGIVSTGVLWSPRTPAHYSLPEAMYGVKEPTEVLPRFALVNIRVVDGDTIDADIPVGLDNWILIDQRIRFADIDCWEASKNRRSVEVTDKEVAMGKEATEFLRKLLAEADHVVGMPDFKQRDAYGRRLMYLWVDGTRVAETLRQAGHERN